MEFHTPPQSKLTTVEQLEDFHKKDKISPELEHKQRIRQKENNEIPEAKCVD